MKTSYTERSPYRKVSVSVRLDGPWYDALERYRSLKPKRSQVLVLQHALLKLPGFQAILTEEKEAYAKELNQHDQKVDIFVRKVNQDIRDAA